MNAKLRALLIPGLMLVRFLVRLALILMCLGVLFLGLVNHYFL